MLELLTSTIGLGIAGMDPIGALIAIAALGSGARSRNVLAYGFLMIAVTVVLGVVLSLVVGTRLASLFDRDLLNQGDRFWAMGEGVAGFVLVAWGIRRIVRPPNLHDSGSKSHGTGLQALCGVGFLYGMSSILDPTFVAVVILAGRHGSFLDAGVSHLLWIMISQLPLVVVLGAILSGRYTTIIEPLKTGWQRIRPWLSRIGTAATLLISFFLLADAWMWLATGEFLVEL